ncbi:universal stress protein [Calidithermus roseus]|uniref:Universal stress protein family protein n=1 Tax=Calidithermus roseus TaxID=1644118 RepID=A0A399EC93_9DEIN|nr:universal stress protein [Calidithermus roseus]RIH82287.1 Universal stress protein family protein [Calidithermus roseus]
MRILHPTDFSPASYKALEFAQHLRGLMGGSLTILHAYEPRYASPAQFFSRENEQIFQQADLEWQRALEQQLRGLDPSAQTILETGKPIPCILHHAAEHDLLVMGTHGEDSLKDRLIGTTTERVIAQTEKPVVVVSRDTALRRLSHLVVATALADPSERALGLAYEIATRSDGSLTLLHVVEPGAVDADQARLHALVSYFPGEARERIQVVVLPSSSPADEALLDYVTRNTASALFMGRSRGSRIFGSVTRNVLNRARVPVFVHP